jgi:predicted nucleic acid-binding protein
MIFIDTSFLGALFIPNDAWHRAARAWSLRVSPRLLTTDYILLEFADGFARQEWRSTADRAIQSIRTNAAIHIVPQSRALFERGLDLYRSRNDKNWSLTDCLSFVVMQDEGCSEALTADHHFEQAGFRALLRAEPQ